MLGGGVEEGKKEGCGRDRGGGGEEWEREGMGSRLDSI